MSNDPRAAAVAAAHPDATPEILRRIADIERRLEKIERTLSALAATVRAG